MTASKNKWLTLSLIAALVVAWGYLRFIAVGLETNLTALYLDCPIWLAIGVLSARFSRDLKDPLDAMGETETPPVLSVKKFEPVGLLLAVLLMCVLWYMPTLFPNLKLKDYGIEINLQNASVTFWSAIAFLAGYRHIVIKKIPVAAWERTKETFKGDEFLKGLGKIFSAGRRG